MSPARVGLALIFPLVGSAAFAQDDALSQEVPLSQGEIEQPDFSGRVINDVIIETQDVFDTSSSEELQWVFEFANRFHIITRDRTIEAQLLFEPGEEYSAQKLAESERILRRNAYLFDASITPTENQNGDLDVLVKTRDNWTFFPEFSYSNTGGESESSYGIEEQNLFGTGTALNIRRESDADRTSSVFEFSGRNIGSERLSLSYGYSDLSDGNTQSLSVQRPFYSLDTPWAAGTSFFIDDRINTLYSLGERGARYRKDQKFNSGFFGVSSGLRDNQAKRWVAGYVADERIFDLVIEEGLVEIAPENRRLNYPYIKYQQLRDEFQKTTNLTQIGRTEDLSMGANYEFTLGYASEGFGSDRNAWLVGGSYRRGYGSPEDRLILLDTGFSSRLESGKLRNMLIQNKTEIFQRQSDKSVLYAAATLRYGENLDLDNYQSLGPENGLRGYPLNYLNTETTLLVNLEQRFYTDYYPLRLYRVGGAVFMDVAKGWGGDPIGTKVSEPLINVGFGLRFGSMRSGSNRIFHLDVAVPFTRSSDVDSVQIQFIGKREF